MRNLLMYTGAAVAASLGSAALAQPANDLCSTALNVPSLPFYHEVADPASAGDDADITCNASSASAARHAVWYTFTPASDFTLRLSEVGSTDVATAIFTGSCGSLTQVACSDPDSFTFAVTSGTQYWIQVSTWSSTATPSTYRLVLSDNGDTTPPANDTCTGAQTLSPGSTFLSNAPGATNDLDVSCNATAATEARHGVWFTYTPATDVSLALSELSSSDTVTTLFTGGCGGLSPVSCSDGESNVYSLTGGTQYHFLVAMFSATTVPTQPYVVTSEVITAPANDTCATAEMIASFPFTGMADGRGAGLDELVSCDVPSAESRLGVWYTFTAPSGGTMTFDENSSTDTFTSVFTGACGALTEVFCSDPEESTFDVAAGTQYFVLLGTWGSTTVPSAPYSLTVSFEPATGACCTGSSCSIMTEADCGAGTYVGDNTLCVGPQVSDEANAEIPDADEGDVDMVGELVRTVTSPDAGAITSLEVALDIEHDWAGDLRIQLTSPSGTVATLLDRADPDPCTPDFAIADSSDLDNIYVFSDSGSETLHAAIVAAGASVIPAGTYQAADCTGAMVSLNSIFAGQPSAGMWTLSVVDADAGVVGTLRSWSLTINGGVSACDDSGTPTDCERADFNDSGNVDATDIFVFLDAWFTQNGQSGPNLSADTDGSGTVDATDIFIFLDLWFAQNGQTCM